MHVIKSDYVNAKKCPKIRPHHRTGKSQRKGLFGSKRLQDHFCEPSGPQVLTPTVFWLCGICDPLNIFCPVPAAVLWIANRIRAHRRRKLDLLTSPPTTHVRQANNAKEITSRGVDSIVPHRMLLADLEELPVHGEFAGSIIRRERPHPQGSVRVSLADRVSDLKDGHMAIVKKIIKSFGVNPVSGAAIVPLG